MTSDEGRVERNGEPDHLESLEARVRKVQHLDPFSLVVHPDGRFRAELSRSVEELKPGTAREVLRELEPVLDRLRQRAEEG